ncbi:hypothetical protein KAR91_55885 [Candidatus Pacearchaeota archaeon]|nr:hypothetical protein [Candidatus Pacearchaeota archaeon]
MVKKLMPILVLIMISCGSASDESQTATRESEEADPVTPPSYSEQKILDKKCGRTYGSIDLDCSNY